MKHLHRVMAAVDDSAPARAAFDHALALSRRHDAELTVVHAVPSDRPFNWHARERRDLIGSLRAAAKAAGVRVKVSVQSGDPAGVILLHANARRADVIVLGSRARSAFDRFRFGSVAETVALAATQPVLVVPFEAITAAASTTPVASIVVGVDFREGSAAAVEAALSIARADTRVTLVHVVPGVSHVGASRYMYHLMEPEYQRQLARDASRRMSEVIRSAAGTSPNVRARVVTGDPAEAIARVAADVAADVIVMGVTARNAIGRRVFGSTAARTIRTAGRPVLAVPQVTARASAAGASADRLALAA